MSSNQRIRAGEWAVGSIIGILVVGGLLSGFALRNWYVWETWVPLAVFAFVIYLFYRLVIAVEHIAYDS